MKVPRATMIATVLVVGVLTLGASSCETQTKNNDNKKQEQAKVYNVGEPVTVGEVRWTVTAPKVLGTTLAATNPYITAKTAQPGAKFVQVTYKVENLGQKQKTTTGADLQDSQKRQFKAITDSFSYQPENRQLNILSNLNPGVAQEFDLIYEIPADATGLQSRVGNLDAFKNKVELVNLGI